MIWSLPQAAFESQFGRFDAGEHHAIVDDLFGVEAQVAVGVLLHLAHDEFLVERTAIHADADGLAVIDAPLCRSSRTARRGGSRAHISGIDAVLIEGARAIGILGQQDVAVVVKIANDGRVAAQIAQPGYDFRDGRGRFRHVHGNAHQLRPGVGEFLALRHGPGDVGGVRVGHRLHDDRRAAAHLNVADLDAIRLSPRDGKYLHRVSPNHLNHNSPSLNPTISCELVADAFWK